MSLSRVKEISFHFENSFLKLQVCRYEFETPLDNYPPEIRDVIKLEVREKMPSPRILQTHLPFYLLHPDLLDTAKVLISSALREEKDSLLYISVGIH